jgi:Bacteriophage lambda head decoration protein D
MVTTFTEKHHAAEFILMEDEGHMSRDNIIIAQNQTIIPGQVLGKLTANGQYAAWTKGAADGSQTAAAIAIYPSITGAGQTAAVAAITRLAEVNGKLLTWGAGAIAADITAGSAALAGTMIIVRP